MAHLFAALASHVFKLHELILFLVLVILIIFIVFLALMLRVLATWMIGVCLTTAPPLCPSIIVSMSTATPVEVLLLMELLSTVTTHFNALIHLSFSIFKFDDSLSHLVSLIRHRLNLFLSIHIIIDVLVELLSLHFEFLIEPLYLLSGSLLFKVRFIFKLFLKVNYFFEVIAEYVSFSYDFCKTLFTILLLKL